MLDIARDMKILIVEDETNIAENIKKKILDLGFRRENVILEKGEDCATYAKVDILEKTFDFAIIDLNLPPLAEMQERAQGYTLLKLLYEKNRDCYVIVHSAFSKYNMDPTVLDWNFRLTRNYIDKKTAPINSVDLVIKDIKDQLFYRQRSIDATIVRIEDIYDISYTYRYCELTCGDKKQMIAGIYCELLEYFLAHRGQPTSLDTLIAKTMNPDITDPMGTMIKRIFYLRKIMEQIGEKKGSEYIINKRGVGYYIEADI